VIEIKTVLLFGGGGGCNSGGSRVHICRDASIQQGLAELMSARKTKA